MAQFSKHLKPYLKLKQNCSSGPLGYRDLRKTGMSVYGHF